MRVLITRPREDAERTATRLRALGHEPLIVPLMGIRFLDGKAIPLDGVQAILATSANGVRAFARRTARRDIPLFAVGPQTEETALQLGFATVRNAQGDAGALAEATRGWAKPEDGALLHVKGSDSKDGLGKRLEGFEVRNVNLYEVAAVERPPEFDAALEDAQAALFYSPRSAELFRKRVEALKLPTNSLIALCISEATAQALKPLTFREIRIAPKPNQHALLDCL
ncbi:MAG TPA: uroporphyrinogen-III synthase [Rhizomicrobium sp.]|nr:uroporphyrinogen-III synthase [Rhizomicrobium sp.]